MREYYFYLSYAHLDLDPYLEQFFHDLEAELKLLTGQSASGFMDRRDVPLVDPFNSAIADALGRSHVLVALYSPAYFQSEFCGKEWAVFLSGRGNTSDATGILPVLWSPPGILRNVPEVAARIQHTDATFPDAYNKQGLRYILRLSKPKGDYFKFIAVFAQMLFQAAESAALASLAHRPVLSQVRTAFRQEATSHAERKLEITREDHAHAKKLLAFLCHASGDKPRVRDLYSKLMASGIDPWLDEKNLLPGQRWSNEITSTVRKADVVIVCFSRDSITKTGYVQKEMRLALDVADEQPEGAMFLIPVRLEDCEIPDRFKHLHYANLFEDDGYTKLMNALQFRASEIGARLLPDG